MELEEEVFLNYLTADNNAKVVSSSSHAHGCLASNLLNSNPRKLWLSKEGLPQDFTIDLTELREKRVFECFGWSCWHAYSSNPSVVELYLGQENKFVKWATLYSELRPGAQYFAIDPVDNWDYLKVVVTNTFGASKTYMNQVFLFDEVPRARKTRPDLDNSLESSEVVSYAEVPSEESSFIKTDENYKYKLTHQLMDLEEQIKMLKLTREPEESPADPQPQIDPENQEIETIKQEVSKWSSTVSDLKSNISSLVQNVKSLQETITTQKVPKKPLSDISYTENFSKAWNRQMQNWENKVLNPLLKQTQKPSNDVGAILTQLQSKLEEKSRKIRELQEGRSRNTSKMSTELY